MAKNVLGVAQKVYSVTENFLASHAILVANLASHAGDLIRSPTLGILKLRSYLV